jgi:hypothetical protein
MEIALFETEVGHGWILLLGTGRRRYGTTGDIIVIRMYV